VTIENREGRTTSMPARDEHRADQEATVADRGVREYVALMGVAPEEALADLRLRSPQLYETVVNVAFAGPLARPALGRVQRELVMT
jgi:hypothetical protein